MHSLGETGGFACGGVDLLNERGKLTCVDVAETELAKIG